MGITECSCRGRRVGSAERISHCVGHGYIFRSITKGLFPPYSETPTQKNLDKLKPLAYKNVVLDTVYKI
jgi:hypothetical protein